MQTRATALTVLDGYPVRIHPGDKYTHAHLFVGGQYIHPIIVTTDGTVTLRDADMFDGPRRTFTPEEQTALRRLDAEVKRQDAAHQQAKRHAQAAAATRTRERHEAKLAGMDDVKIYD
jgi:hypothetical protein